jgi:DHA1 family bicyclomycin/chloramphenicol resistance-like MFS transporter
VNERAGGGNLRRQRQPSEDRNLGFAVLLAALGTLGPLSIDTYLPSFPDMGHEFGVAPLGIQQTLTAYLAPFAVMTLWHGALSDAVGRRRVVLVSLMLFAIASAGCALAWSLPALCGMRVLQGMTAGAGMIVGRAVVRDVFEGSAAQRVMAHVSMMFTLAPALAPVIGGWLHAQFGWRSVFWFLTLAAAGLAVWAWLALPETLPSERRHPLHAGDLARAYGRVLSHSGFLAVCGAIGLNFGVIFAYVTSAPAFLMGHLGLRETEFLWLFGPVTAGMLVGSWWAARVAGRLTPPETIGRAYAVMGLAAVANLAVCALLPPRVPWSVAPLFFYAAGMALAMPSLTLMALDFFPERKGLAASCQAFVVTGFNTAVAAVFAPVLAVSPMRLAMGGALMMAAGGALAATQMRARAVAAPPA